MMAVVALSGSFRISRMAVYPSMMGIWMSMKMMSKCWRVASSRASRPFSAVR